MTTAAAGLRQGDQQRNLVWAVLAGALLAALMTAFGAFGWLNGDEEQGRPWLEWAIDLAVIAVMSLVVYRVGRGGMRAGNTAGAAKRTLAFGVLAPLSLPFFWLGVYALFAMAALALGVRVLTSGSTRGETGMAIVGIVLGALGLVACGSANLFG